jgi:hypothetical protein
VFFSGSHALPNCGKLSKLPPKERAELVFDKKCCFRCLLPGHASKGCTTKITCTHENCKSYHHPMMHGAPRMPWPPSSQPDKKKAHLGPASTTAVSTTPTSVTPASTTSKVSFSPLYLREKATA